MITENKDNRQQILECALRLFAKKGYDGVSAQEIVDAAGVTKPTMYHYFGSKEGLLQDIFKVYYTDFLRKLEGALTLPEDVSLSVFRLIRVFFDTALFSEDFFAFRSSLTLRSGEDAASLTAAPYIKKEFDLINEFFCKASKNAGNLRGKETQCTRSFIGVVSANTSAYLYSKNEELLSDETALRIRQQFLYGIYS